MTVIFMHGYPFTWERGRGTERWVEERLDRAVANLPPPTGLVISNIKTQQSNGYLF